jgi:hypothetical protein
MLVILSLSYGCVSWTLEQRYTRRLKTTEMNVVKRTARYSLLDILEELNVDPVDEQLAQYKQKCLNHVRRMEDIRYPKQILDYRPIGRRRPGRPLKRLLDGYNREAGTGHLLASFRDQKSCFNTS